MLQEAENGITDFSYSGDVAYCPVSYTHLTANRDKFRPVYHHTPLYGWMNDANGLVYKDGEYHLLSLIHI